MVPVDLPIDLNGTPIVTETFRDGASRTINEIFDSIHLNTGDNDLIVSRMGNSGSLIISDLIMVYSVPS
jgi:hypothetical protein